MFLLFVGFLLGILAVVCAEGLALYWALQWLGKKRRPDPPASGRCLDADQTPLTYPYEKQGIIWVLEPDKFPKNTYNDSSAKGSKEQKNKKEIVEVSPVKRNAKLKNQSLILIDHDGNQNTIELVGCNIVAVSSSNLPSRKWIKRYPVKVESNKIIFNGSKICFLYFETSWEKESWCKALRLSSDKEKAKWHAQVSDEFQDYLTSLNAGYQLFSKPSAIHGDTFDKSIKIDGGAGASKVRHLFKKFAKKATKIGVEYKANVMSNRGEKKLSDKLQSTQDALSASGSTKSSSSEKSSLLDVQTALLAHSNLGSQQVPSSDVLWEDKSSFDEGTLCLNSLFSRMFFDVKRSTHLNSLIKARIQRTLSNLRIPSYIGGITCTSLDFGSLPPYIHSMRALPLDMKEGWAIEVDIEYSGGLVLGIETRLEVNEPEFQKSLVDNNLEQSSSGEVPSDLIEDFECYSNNFKQSIDLTDETDGGEDVDKQDYSTLSGWKSSYVSRWKTIMKTIAAQVSQVPLSLSIKVAFLRGIMRLHVKPPPSDQIWISFAFMPEIDFNLDSSVGDHKIASAQVALLIGNRFKAAIRESLVLPNYESICIPWMIVDKDDWVPRSTAPFVWIHQESSNDSASHSGEIKITPESVKEDKISCDSSPENNDEKIKTGLSAQQSLSEPVESVTSDIGRTTSVSSDQSTSHSGLEKLKEPLLANGGILESPISSRVGFPEESVLVSDITLYGHVSKSPEDDGKLKKMGRRARMLDLGKKMTEKFEEKRRHIEEKGRHMVEKMRENARTSEGTVTTVNSTMRP